MSQWWLLMLKTTVTDSQCLLLEQVAKDICHNEYVRSSLFERAVKWLKHSWVFLVRNNFNCFTVVWEIPLFCWPIPLLILRYFCLRKPQFQERNLPKNPTKSKFLKLPQFSYSEWYRHHLNLFGSFWSAIVSKTREGSTSVKGSTRLAKRA